MTFNERIRKLRNEKGVSQREIAEYLGITKQAYSLYELGKRDPDNQTLYMLSDYFAVSLDYLLGKSRERSSITDDDIKFALFGGEGEITDEMYDEVVNFAQYVKEKYKKKD